MNIIISHDVDHISVSEHLTKDLIVPKFIIRAKLDLFTGKISLTEFYFRITDLLKNKWHRIPELIAYNKSKNIDTSFFVGMANGKGLSYKNELAFYWANYIANQQVEVGVHGIAFDNLSAIENEFTLFKKATALDSFGIRMHYLRNDSSTLNLLNKAGYKFDCTELAFKNPYQIGNMWEFPLQIMDGHILLGNKRRQTRTLEQAIEQTKINVQKAVDLKLDYLNILFHDRYFDEKSFYTWFAWYTWVIEYCQQNKFEFCNYKTAIKKLEKR
ncbi:MAG: hypothetical protein J0M08_02070 [Bacteroidetes bacterium]|nr:hypothetical protein [Bacteroidota bacterium]